MKPVKIMVTLAIAAGLASGAGVATAAIANADAGPVVAWQAPQDRGPWHDDGHGWHGPGRGDHRWDNRGWDDPVPGGWNGGWEPWGGVCLFGACI